MLALAGSASAKITVKHLEEAARAYEQSLSQRSAASPADIVERHQRVRAAEAAERWTEAIDHLELLAGAQPQSLESWQRLAKTLSIHRPAEDRALAAGYLAYLKAGTAGEEIEALLTTGLVLRSKLQWLADESQRIGRDVESLELMSVDQSTKRSEADYAPDVTFPATPGAASPRSALTALDQEAGKARTRRLVAEQKAVDTRYATLTGIAHEVYSELFARLQREISNQEAPWKELRDHGDANAVVGPFWKSDKKAAAACFDLSSALKPPPFSYRSSVSVQRHGDSDLSALSPVEVDVTVEANRLCIHGLTHGQFYAFEIKKGLPFGTGSKLDLGKSLVRQRAPHLPATAYFRNAAYVVPNSGHKSLPLHTVNVRRLGLELVKISDRNIYRQVALRQIGSNIEPRDLEQLYSNFSEPIWRGELAISDRIDNEQRTTHLPIGKLLEERRRWIRSGGAREGRQAGRADGFFSSGTFYQDPASYQSPATRLWEPGVYALVAKLPELESSVEGPGQYPVQWFIFTDIGLTYLASPAELHVVARSLSTGEMKPGVKIQLLARNNRVLAEALTNAQGVATFDARLAQGSHGNRLAAILAHGSQSENVSDFSYVDLIRDALDLSRVGVAGREPPGALDAFVYTDRGAYRPDPDYPVRATVIVRAADGPDLYSPVRLQLRSAQGGVLGTPVEISPQTLKEQFGGASAALGIPKTAPLGTAYVEVLTDSSSQPIARATIQIAHIRPDRARLGFAPEAQWRADLSTDGTLTIAGSANAQYLHGRRPAPGEAPEAPVAGATGDVEISVEAADEIRGLGAGCYRDFQFGAAEDAFRPHLTRIAVGPSGQDGKIDISGLVSGLPPISRPLIARLTLSLHDEAGALAAQKIELPVLTKRALVGLRHAGLTPVSADRHDASVELAAIDSDQSPRAGARLHWRLKRERTEFIWQYVDDSWSYRPDFGYEEIDSGEVLTQLVQAVACTRGTARVDLRNLRPGTYVFEGSDEEDNRSSVRFTIGVTNPEAKRPEPNLVKVIAIDRRAHANAPTDEVADFSVGTRAEFDIETPFDGPVLAAVVDGNRIRHWIHAAAVNRSARLTVEQVPEAWAGQGLHLLVSVFRGEADDTESRGPARAIGALYFTVNRERSHLRVGLHDTPFQIAPSSRLPVQLTAEDASGRFSGKAMVALYAVDEGLINLTGHAVPQPFQHFHGPRRLSFEIHDSYSRLLLRREGGDAGRSVIERLIFNNYLSDEIVALADVRQVTFVGGVASLELPGDRFSAFSGTVRLAAVVWTDEKIGAAHKNVLVRDALVVSLGLPRFLAPSDRPILPLTLENIEALEDVYEVSVEGLGIARVTLPGQSGPIDIRDNFKVRLASGERKVVLLHGAVGEAATERPLPIVAEVRAADGGRNPLVVKRQWSIKVRHPFVPVVSQLRQESLPPSATLRLLPSETDLSRLKWPSVQARFSTTPFPVPAGLPVGELTNQANQLDRLAWSAFLLLQQSRGEPGAALGSVLENLIALQHRSGGFLPYKLDQTLTGRESVRRIKVEEGTASDYGYDPDLWRTALAVDVLRLASKDTHRYHRNLRAAVDFLKRQASRELGRSADFGGRESTVPVAVLDPSLPVRSDGEILEEAANAEAAGKDGQPPRAPGSLDVSVALVGAELAGRLGLREQIGVVVRRASGTARTAGLKRGDVIYAVDGSEVYDPATLDSLLESAGAGTVVTLDVRNQAGRSELSVTLDEASEASRCTEALAYAVYVLVRLDEIELMDLLHFVEACTSDRSINSNSKLARLILAAALTEFGKPELARPLLQDVRDRLRKGIALAPGLDRLAYLGQLLTFLDRLSSEAPEISMVLQEIDKIRASGQPISIAANGWFARAALERTTQSMVDVELSPAEFERYMEPGDHYVATSFIDEADLRSSPVQASNKGNAPVSVTLFVRGFPTEVAAKSPDFVVKRRYFRPDGSELEGPEVKVAHNELVLVVVEGRLSEPATQSADGPIESVADPLALIVDLIPAGFEIVHGDLYQAGDDGAQRSPGDVLPAGLGERRHVELRDDRYIAVVEPADDRSRFRVAYAVRATTAGQFRVPQVRVEDLHEPEVSADALDDRVLTVKPRKLP
ncbi:MAG: PDZ domain-containing protein [Hyphomicrobiaceae bacterium]|nr:PDZ domain-containing protein [Hyphomicrobiaceae bacterium]